MAGLAGTLHVPGMAMQAAGAAPKEDPAAKLLRENRERASAETDKAMGRWSSAQGQAESLLVTFKPDPKTAMTPAANPNEYRAVQTSLQEERNVIQKLRSSFAARRSEVGDANIQAIDTYLQGIDARMAKVNKADASFLPAELNDIRRASTQKEAVLVGTMLSRYLPTIQAQKEGTFAAEVESIIASLPTRLVAASGGTPGTTGTTPTADQMVTDKNVADIKAQRDFATKRLENGSTGPAVKLLTDQVAVLDGIDAKLSKKLNDKGDDALLNSVRAYSDELRKLRDDASGDKLNPQQLKERMAGMSKLWDAAFSATSGIDDAIGKDEGSRLRSVVGLPGLAQAAGTGGGAGGATGSPVGAIPGGRSGQPAQVGTNAQRVGTAPSQQRDLDDRVHGKAIELPANGLYANEAKAQANAIMAGGFGVFQRNGKLDLHERLQGSSAENVIAAWTDITLIGLAKANGVPLEKKTDKATGVDIYSIAKIPNPRGGFYRSLTNKQAEELMGVLTIAARNDARKRYEDATQHKDGSIITDPKVVNERITETTAALVGLRFVNEQYNARVKQYGVGGEQQAYNDWYRKQGFGNFMSFGGSMGGFGGLIGMGGMFGMGGYQGIVLR